MDLSIVRQLSLGVVPSALAGLIVFALLWWRRRAAAEEMVDPRTEPLTRLQRWLPAVVLGALYWPLHIALFGRIPMPPQSAFDWLRPLFLLSGVAMALVALLPPSRLRVVSTGTVATALLVGGMWVSARSPIAHSWSAAESAGRLGAAVALGLFFVVGLIRLAATPGPLRIAITTLILIAVSQALVLLFFSFKLGQVVGVVAAFVAAAFPVALARRRLQLGPALPAAGGVVAAVAIWQAVLFGEAESPLLPGVAIALLPWLALGTLEALRLALRRRPAAEAIGSAR